jgi:hypothetical protein
VAGTLRLLWAASRDCIDHLLMWNALGECHAWARDLCETLVIIRGDARRRLIWHQASSLAVLGARQAKEVPSVWRKAPGRPV